VRHDLRADITIQERRKDSEEFLRSIEAELRTMEPQLVAMAAERRVWVKALPGLLMDWPWLLSAARGLLWATLLVLVWFLARRRAERIAGWVMWRITRLGLPFEDRPERWRTAIADGVRPILDTALAWTILGVAASIAPELGILVAAWGYGSLFVAFRALSALLVSPTSHERPAITTVSDRGYQRMGRTIYAIGVWFIATYVLDSTLSELFFADALAAAVYGMGWLVGSLLLLVLLVSWEPLLAARIQRMGRLPDPMHRWLERGDGTWVAPVRAAVLGSYLFAAAVWDVVQGRLAQREGTGAVVGLLDRARFMEAHDVGERLPLPVIRKLTTGDVPPEVQYPRVDEERVLVEHFAAWSEERRLGTTIVAGDRGDGKYTFMERVRPLLRLDGRLPVEITIQERITSEAKLIAWMAGVCELDEVPADLDGLIAAIDDKPGRVWVMHGLHLCFLRTVGGFGALRSLLYVCNATSAKHFWVLLIHRPAWAYLCRLGPLLSTGGVRAVIELRPLTGKELRQLVLERSAWAEVEVDFRRLDYNGPFSASPEVERERAISSYFRLLADASGGCVMIALRLWAKSLRVGPDGCADVVVIKELIPGAQQDLSAPAMFALTALRHQDRLTLQELSQVINEPVDDVRAIIRELQHQGIVHVSPRGARIDDLLLISVTRTLRRRHFLQWSV
jgi:hypothetical protein